VAVRGWDVKSKEAVVATQNAAPPSGAAATRRVFGTASLTVPGQSGQTVADVTPIAQGQFSALSMGYVAGDVIAFGLPQLQADTVVDITGAGQTFSGRYYVTSVTHTVTNEQGYQTSFTVQRSTA
jgi:phage protein D